MNPALARPELQPPLFRFGAFELDVRTGELRKSGQRIKLQEQPFQILATLLERPGEVVTRDELRNKLWPGNTFVDFDTGLNKAINKIREALDDSADTPRFVETLPRRGYRFIGPVERPSAALAVMSVSSPAEVRPAVSPPDARRPERWPRAMAALAILAATGLFVALHRPPLLTQRDTIVLADFRNETGDPVFDGALKQALAVSLAQSPFLNILSDQRVHSTLLQMTRPAQQRLTEDVAREVCERTGSKAYIAGSIAELGGQYVIGLNAMNCVTGDALARQQVQAANKQQVLAALGTAVAKLRNSLGESLSSIARFDVPLAQATTPSLEALQSFSLGATMIQRGDQAAAVPFFQRAIRLDPDFAIAYAALGMSYYILREQGLAAENLRKAYELRERGSEWEKLYIESHYHHMVTGNLEKARQVYELWVQTYPRDYGPANNLGVIYQQLGQYDKGLAQFGELFRAGQDYGQVYANLVSSYLYLNRLKEAQATVEEAQAKKLDAPAFHDFAYQIAFLQNDAAAMAQQTAWAAGKPGMEDVLLAEEADTAAYSGRLGKARELSRHAVASAERAEQKETAASYEAEAALREALFGNGTAAHERAKAALGLSTGRDAQYGAALALAFAGDPEASGGRAQALADDLRRRFPEDTLVQSNYLPTLRAQLALNRNDASGAIEALQAAGPYELATTGVKFNFLCLYPVYVRGEAYLAAHQGSQAAAEFQKILNHRGVVLNEPIAALSYLGLARAYALQAGFVAPGGIYPEARMASRGSPAGGAADPAALAKARTTYEDFFTLWKDADPNIPILKQARAEYAKLR